MKKILLSLSMIVFVGAVAIGATGAFFSDTETSTGNTFTAGAIDLTINADSLSLANGGDLDVAFDNAGAAVFNFTDIKPGDHGVVAFDIDVTSNEAYVCAINEIMESNENDLIEPELPMDTDGTATGELDKYLRFAIFADYDLDGIYDANTEPLNNGGGTGFTAAELTGAGWISVADQTAPNTWLIAGSVLPNTDYSAGFMYCFGEIDGDGVCSVPTNPSVDYNDSQTDSLVGSIEFYSVQTRNNDGFKCSDLTS